MFDLEPTAKLICLTSEQLHVLLDYTREYFEQKHNRPEHPLVDIKEAMKILDVSERTIHNYKNDGKIKYHRPSGGKLYFDRQSLYDYLEGKSQKTEG